MAATSMFNEKGVPDFVLLSELSENALLKNLIERFQSDFIYTYIGEVVVSMNPYKKIDKLFNKQKMEEYKGRYMYEVAPHVYSLSNDVYRSMLRTHENQCVIISGESGAGKTEASKILMQYVAYVSRSSAEVDRVKNQLLESNPILEAFGNAKTLRNDNSSRFGKYMEIQFEKDGAPVGGRITNYLLEKSRVVTRAVGERSFHIFYQMLAGLTPQEMTKLRMQKDPLQYQYLRSSECTTVPGTDDVMEFKTMNKAMEVMGFSAQQRSDMWSVLSAILQLGNLGFTPSGVGKNVTIQNTQVSDVVGALLGVNSTLLIKVLTSRSITTGASKRASNIIIPLDMNAAAYTRDALAKGIYSNLFNWLVQQINGKLQCRNPSDKLVIGILDIYGFEVFENNSFEQFCINLCNEKLQQLFIELTLKSEQEEYVREGIKWEPVKYFNNQIIVDLIEGKGKAFGITNLMDECCLIAESTDKSFVTKMDTAFPNHPHYVSYVTSKNKNLSDLTFVLKHYAGDVAYNAAGFLEKNKDTLFNDLIDCMNISTNALVKQLFPPVNINSKKRPLTAITQFKMALSDLMSTLLACQPHYIRCIKPNDNKKPGVIDKDRVQHQVRYLGLLENVRVRRAGFAYRSPYERFLWRYKMICPQTWPMAGRTGNAQTNVQQIMTWMKFDPKEYQFGKTKIFIRNATSLFALEEKREKEMPKLVLLMQTAWRGYLARSRWAQTKAVSRIILSYRKYKFNRWFMEIRRNFENVKRDPNWGRDVSWPKPPPVLAVGASLLKRVHACWRAKKMIESLTAEQQAEMRQKVLAYTIFHGKKPWAFSRRFLADYLELDTNPNKDRYIQAMTTLFSQYGDKEVHFADYVIKINSKNKGDRRGVVVTDANIYKHDPKTYKIKRYETPLGEVKSIACSPFSDGFVVVHVNEPYRDLLLDLSSSGPEKASEFVCAVLKQIKLLRGISIPVEFVSSTRYNSGRDPKKPGAGTEYSLNWTPTSDAKQANSGVFKTGKNNQNIVLYK